MFKFLKNKLKTFAEKLKKTAVSESEQELEKQELEKTFEQEKQIAKPEPEQARVQEVVEQQQVQKVLEKAVKEEEKQVEKEKEKIVSEKLEARKQELVKPESEEKQEKQVIEQGGLIEQELKQESTQALAESRPELEQEQVKQEIEQQAQSQKREKKGFISLVKRKLSDKIVEKIGTTTLKEDKFLQLFDDLELELLQANVALEVVDALKRELREKLVDKRLKRSELDIALRNALMDSIKALFKTRLNPEELLAMVKQKNAEGEPFIILLLGVNGSGKTTTAAKLAKFFKNHGLKPVLAAADTFRAASIEQLDLHGKKLQVPVIKHHYGSDPAAVAFDAVKHAKAKHLNVVIIDTAGRLHSNKDLMQELAKIVRVNKPDLKIFVGEAITGNDCLEQARIFNEMIGIDAIILAKADVDDKGGAVLSTSYVTQKPLIFLGVGQDYDALQAFNPEDFVNALLN